MAHNDCIEAHSLNGEHGITEALTLYDTGGTGSDIYNICTEIFTGSLKGGTGTSGRLVENRNDGLAPEGGHLLDITMNDILHFLGRLKDEADFFRREVLQIQYIFAEQ